MARMILEKTVRNLGMNIQFKLLCALLIFGCLGCTSDDDSTKGGEAVITSGNADFSTYVAVGNSLVAGFTDGALFIAGQESSIPNIMAQQFSLVGGGEFIQPLMSDNIGGALVGGTPVFSPRLYFDGTGPVVLDATPSTEITNILPGPYNNMGIPGAKSFHVLANGYGNVAGLSTLPPQSNPYFVRIASSPNASIIEDALVQDPTFFSLWIGNNDVLGYAITGGDGTDPITDETLFENAYTEIINALTSRGAKGVVANIADVTSIAHFTTVPFAPLDPTNQNFGPLIPTLNGQFAILNGVFAFLNIPERSIEFAVDAASAVVIKDESLIDFSVEITETLMANNVDAGTAAIFGFLYGQARQANENDLLVLPSSSIIGQVNTDVVTSLMNLGLPEDTAGQLAVNGVTFPLEDKWVLLPSEQQEITDATTTFNNIISSAVEQAGLAFVDANALSAENANGGTVFDEFLLESNLVFGGFVSLDGVHPTARGYAFLANKMMEAINTTYESSLPMVKAADYGTFYSVSLP